MSIHLLHCQDSQQYHHKFCQVQYIFHCFRICTLLFKKLVKFKAFHLVHHRSTTSLEFWIYIFSPKKISFCCLKASKYFYFLNYGINFGPFLSVFISIENLHFVNVTFSQKGLIRSSFLQTDKPNYFLS